MTSHTKITLSEKDQIGCKHEIIIEDCLENPDWFTLKTRMIGDEKYEILSLPKEFIHSITEALNKLC